jgi:ribonuclease HI
MVSQLIDETSASWREEVIRENFLPVDAKVILSIPLCTRRQPDYWAWNYEHKGIFSVRSAYRMMINLKISRENYFEGNAGSSNSVAEEKGWISLWKTSVPSKIKVFLWRLAKQSIPTADVLAHRNMATSSTCSLCGAEDSWRHSLIECNMANSVWVLSKSLMVEHMIACDERSAKLWLFHLKETLPHDQFTRLTVTLWAIWLARRKAIHEEIFQNPMSTHGFINSYLEELKLLPKPVQVARVLPPNPRLRARWVPPAPGLFKFNVDASVARSGEIGAAAAFCHDSNGVYQGASSIVIRGVTDPFTLEAIACREALALADDLGVNRIHVASDCKVVIDDITGGTNGRYGAIILEIKERASRLHEKSFSFGGRASNFEAHNLARFSTSLDIGRHLWLGNPYSDEIPVNIMLI